MHYRGVGGAVSSPNPKRSRLRNTIRILYQPSKKPIKVNPPTFLSHFALKFLPRKKDPSSFFLPGEKSHMYRHMDIHMEHHMVCHMESHMDSHMENENENENEDVNDNENSM